MSNHTSFTIGPESDPDKYRLLRQVGSGGEAELWQATVLVGEAEETVAVKILRDVHALDPQLWRERWDQQVELLRLVRHVGVVGVHESFVGARMHRPGEADDATRQQYLVMNWVVGADLKQWIAGGGEHAEGLRHLMQVADVLDWLHHGRATPSGRPVVHGDLSPGNVIVNPDGQAVLVDFGLAHIVSGAPAGSAGTQGFCAPEVVAGGEYGAPADRYAFGALTYFVVTGETPPATASELRQALSQRLGPVFEGADAANVVAIAADDPQERPTPGEWLRRLRPHATTVVPRETPLPPAHAAALKTKPPVMRTASTIRASSPKKLVSGGFALGVLTALLVFLVIGAFQSGNDPAMEEGGVVGTEPGPDGASQEPSEPTDTPESPEESEPSSDTPESPEESGSPSEEPTPTSTGGDGESTVTLWLA